MKKWIFTAIGDSYGLEQRLNELARSGYELTNDEDGICCWGSFSPTSRQELRYHVESAPPLRTNEQLLRRVGELRAMGWESRCTLNGLDVYASAPLRFPEEPVTPASRSYGLISLFTLLLGGLLCGFSPGQQWYLSNFGVFLYLSRGLFPVGALWMLWRLIRLAVPPRRAASSVVVRLRGVLSAAWWLWWLLLPVSAIASLLPLPWALAVLFLGLILRLLVGFVPTPEGKTRWRGRISPSLGLACLGLTLLLAIGLNQLGISASVRDYGTSSAPWPRSWAVSASDVMEQPGELVFTEYRKSASLLVRGESLSEVREGQRLECQRYTCLVPALNRALSAQWRAQLPAEGEIFCVTQGRQTLLLWCARPCDTNPEPRMRELLNR